MKKFLFGALFFMAFLIAGKAFAASVSCGIDKKCKDGYYCSGAIGETESGVCVPNAMNIGLCRFIKYVRTDILSYLFLFGAMFAGVLMWIGKFTMTTLVQILLGIGVIQGAQGLIVLLSGGQPYTTCTVSEVKECAAGTTGAKTPGGKTVAGTSMILNLGPVEPDSKYNPNRVKCDEPLTCFKAKCDEYTKEDKPPLKPGGSPTVLYKKGDKQKIVDWVPGSGRAIDIEDSQAMASEITLKFQSTYSPDGSPPSSIQVRCVAYMGTYSRDYFECKNPCTGVNYGAEVSHQWNIDTCAELALRNIK